MLFQEVLALIKKEFVLEWRQRYALNGMILYVFSTVFICYLSFNVKGAQLHPITWNALFWIIILFTAINGIAKSFNQERYGRFYYYYALVSAQGIIVAKMIYNALLMLLLAILGISVYSLVLGNPVADWPLYLLNMILSAIGFSTTLTLVSGIASKASNSPTLMAILSFPVILPMLLIIIAISKNAIDGLDRSVSDSSLLVLVAINLIVLSLSYILFPYLWRS